MSSKLDYWIDVLKQKVAYLEHHDITNSLEQTFFREVLAHLEGEVYRPVDDAARDGKDHLIWGVSFGTFQAKWTPKFGGMWIEPNGQLVAADDITHYRAMPETPAMADPPPQQENK